MSETTPNKNQPVIVGLGEVLFDCFPDRTVLGGAPVNVAVHAHQLFAPLGGRGVVVSRVGDDDLGRKLVSELESRGLGVSSIQLDKQLPTGTVQVTVSNSGEPSYEITENVAWDNLQVNESLEQLAAQCSAVCFGSLAQRSGLSGSTIQRFLSLATQAVRVFDVNLRQHYFSKQVLRDSLDAASVVKLNEDELSIIGELLADELGSEKGTEESIERIAELFELECIAITRGSDGTVLYKGGERFDAEPISITRIEGADNVGAGDACLAGLVFGLLMDWDPNRTLTLANRMGAFVASRPGATPTLSDDILEFAAENSPHS